MIYTGTNYTERINFATYEGKNSGQNSVKSRPHRNWKFFCAKIWEPVEMFGAGGLTLLIR